MSDPTPPPPPSQTPPPSYPPPPVDYSAGGPGSIPSTPDDRMMAALAHGLAIITGFLAPLIIWLIQKDKSAFVNDQAKEALNFQITMFIASVVCGLLACIVIGLFLLPVLVIGNIVLCAMAAFKAKDGIVYRYPFALRLIK